MLRSISVSSPIQLSALSSLSR